MNANHDLGRRLGAFVFNSLPYLGLLALGCNGTAGGAAVSGAPDDAAPSAGAPPPSGTNPAPGGVSPSGQPPTQPGATPTGDPGPPPVPQWSASIGSWCGPGDDKTVWLVANDGAAGCEERAPNIYGGGTLDGFSVQLTEEQLSAMPAIINVPVRHCEGGICETLNATLNLSAYAPEQGLSGDWELTFADGVSTQGKLQADWCKWDDTLPSHPEGNRLVAGLQMQEIAVYQAVKVPIMQEFAAPGERNAPLVVGRPALVRVFAEPGDTFEPHEVRGRLTLHNEDVEPLVLEQTRVVEGGSSDADPDSTFNFEIPAEAILPGTTYSVELLETIPCAGSDLAVSGARFPEADLEMAPLEAVEVGGVKIELIPVRFDGDGSGRLPDTSEEQLARFEKRLLQVFPIPGLTLTVREEPVGTMSSDIGQVLEQVRDLRASDNPPLDLNYYGLVKFTEEFGEYCQNSCTTGIAGLPFRPTGGSGAGVGYSGNVAAGTFVHEIGHVLGRRHSPCDVGGDEDYPYEGGRIGSWGYNIYDKDFYDPDKFNDFMGYCRNTWVSDYVYNSLAEFIERLNTEASEQSFFGVPGDWRTVILKAGEAPAWGLTSQYSGVPDGTPEQARVLDHSGEEIEQVTVYRTAAGDHGISFVSVPAPTTSNWWAIDVDGGAPLDFSGNPGFGPFTETSR